MRRHPFTDSALTTVKWRGNRNREALDDLQRQSMLNRGSETMGLARVRQSNIPGSFALRGASPVELVSSLPDPVRSV
jgi:hypothetical protein